MVSAPQEGKTPAAFWQPGRATVKIDTIPEYHGKSLLINYPSPVLAIHTYFVYNSVIGAKTPRVSEIRFRRTN